MRDTRFFLSRPDIGILGMASADDKEQQPTRFLLLNSRNISLLGSNRFAGRWIRGVTGRREIPKMVFFLLILGNSFPIAEFFRAKQFEWMVCCLELTRIGKVRSEKDCSGRFFRRISSGTVLKRMLSEWNHFNVLWMSILEALWLKHVYCHFPLYHHRGCLPTFRAISGRFHYFLKCKEYFFLNYQSNSLVSKLVV